MIFWTIVVIIIALALGVGKLVERRQTATNAPGWKMLTPIIAGRVEGNGVQGIYCDRLTVASLELLNDVAQQYWQYTLAVGANAPSTSQDWKVDYTGAEPQHRWGNETIWRQVFAGISVEDLRATGFHQLFYNAKKGELSGSYRLVGAGLDSNLTDFAKVSPPPTPEAFKAQLEFLVRLAEMNQVVNHQA